MFQHLGPESFTTIKPLVQYMMRALVYSFEEMETETMTRRPFFNTPKKTKMMSLLIVASTNLLGGLFHQNF